MKIKTDSKTAYNIRSTLMRGNIEYKKESEDDQIIITFDTLSDIKIIDELNKTLKEKNLPLHPLPEDVKEKRSNLEKYRKDAEFCFRCHSSAPIFSSASNTGSVWTHLIQGDYSESPYISLQQFSLEHNVNNEKTNPWSFMNFQANLSGRSISLIDIKYIKQAYNTEFQEPASDINQKEEGIFKFINGFNIGGDRHDFNDREYTTAQIASKYSADPLERLVLGDIPQEAVIYFPNKNILINAVKNDTIIELLEKAEHYTFKNGYSINLICDPIKKLSEIIAESESPEIALINLLSKKIFNKLNEQSPISKQLVLQEGVTTATGTSNVVSSQSSTSRSNAEKLEQAEQTKNNTGLKQEEITKAGLEKRRLSYSDYSSLENPKWKKMNQADESTEQQLGQFKIRAEKISEKDKKIEKESSGSSTTLTPKF